MTDFAAAADRVADGADPRTEAAGLVASMTTAEKLDCLDGDQAFWPGLVDMVSGGYSSRPFPAAAVERLGVPGLAFADGPRGCVVGPATTFPVSMARGASFDPELERRVGRAIGTELRAMGATYTGAVCLNLLHHPAWGRAQETYGEDPHHVGEMAAALTEGLQEHVMACMKHFALNSMENARFTVDVHADERALHEVYLPHFRRVAAAGVASVMSAYNAVNGHWCAESEELLTRVLREEWGWDGFVITDFILGLRDPVASLRAGCHVEMPFRQQRALALADALAAGDLDADLVDRRVAEVVATFLRFAHVFGENPSPDVLASPEHRRLAREAAVESAVLLTNDGLLPVDPSSVSRVAVLGRLAPVATLGDGGSSNVVHTPAPVTPLDGLRAAFPDALVVHSDDDAAVAADADLTVVVVGLTKQDEGEYLGPGMAEVLATLAPPIDHPATGSDDPAVRAAAAALAGGMVGADAMAAGGGFGETAGGDRDSLRLPADQEQLIEAACDVSDRVLVVLVAGSAVVAPWLDRAQATLLLWYAGSEAGHALADVVTGTEPGGRLPFAVPRDETDLPAFDKEATEATYGLRHGQWWLDARGTEARLPFGHGLSYASVALGPAAVVAADGTAVRVEVTNTSARAGATVVQVYGSVPGSAHDRPARRLVGFRKVRLVAGESRTVDVAVDRAQLDVRIDGRWVREDLPVELAVGLDATHLEPVPAA